MIVLVWIALGLAITSLGVSCVALRLSLRRLSVPALPPVSAKLELPVPTPSPLEGLSVVLAISQDHPHPVFADMLSEILRKLDVEATTIRFADLDREGDQSNRDLVIFGTVTCNGYAEVYYRAQLTCVSQSETICTIIENPASGDRQANLATELVSRIETEITKRISRNERRLALRELREP